MGFPPHAPQLLQRTGVGQRGKRDEELGYFPATSLLLSASRVECSWTVVDLGAPAEPLFLESEVG